MAKLFIYGLNGETKEIDLSNTTTEDVMSQIKSDVRDMAAAEKEKCDYCEATGPGAAAWGGACHDCDNQLCQECGQIDCEHEF